MSNLEKYNKLFQDCFSVKEEELAGLVYQGVDTWDSVGHMSFISQLEEVFDIEMETDDIIDFESYEVGREILKKYHIDL